LLGLVLSAIVASACGMLGPDPVTYNAYYLTCCTKADIDHLWQPGTEVDLHWIVEAGTRTTVNPTHKLVVGAALTGPYSDVATLKQAKGATHAVQGSIVRIDDRVAPSEPEVSIFLLPADLPPGYYNLETKVDFGDGSSAGGGTIVRVGS
jgi:hypothetical protein